MRRLHAVRIGDHTRPRVCHWRPRQLAARRGDLLHGMSLQHAWKVPGEGAGHGTRGRVRSTGFHSYG